MRLVLVRHLWGVTEPPEICLPRFKSLGFDGIAAPTSVMEPAQATQFHAVRRDLGLGWIMQDFTCLWERGRSVEDHLTSLRRMFRVAKEQGAILLNVHGGADDWRLADMIRYHREAQRMAADAGIPMAHETHRGRCLYSPWTTREIIEAVPEVTLTVDFSHWTVVAERLLEDQSEIIRLAADRAVHIHARVGYENGPQVPDPRAPEYANAVACHERWWNWCWESMSARGISEVFLTPEFGPGSYLHHLPFTNVPVADLDAICTWQAHRQRDRFQKRFQK